jgi:[ribosomal protein S18]-alanine N-acetyltransferase
MQDMVNGLLNPAYHYYTVWDHEENLIGYRCFGEDARVPGGDYREEALDMGGGLRPDLTGQGLGAPFVRSAINFALEEFSPKAFRATVASFNIRALRVCESVGYRKIRQSYSPQIKETFFILWRDTD